MYVSFCLGSAHSQPSPSPTPTPRPGPRPNPTPTVPPPDYYSSRHCNCNGCGKWIVFVSNKKYKDMIITVDVIRP